LDNDYIETEWWILKEFFDKGLIYEGHKILPYCPRCGTGLASHEVSLGYKEVNTNTVTAMFKRKDEDAYFLAWTTTPWTLPSNVSLTVGADIDYVKARVRPAEAGGADGKIGAIAREHGGKVFYVAAALADKVLGKGNYDVLASCKGRELERVEYDRIMPFIDVFANTPGGKAFYVTVNDYVTVEDGTGIVHTAPAFGEDDYQTGRKYGLPVPNPVDEDGKFTATPWAGRFVMEDGLDAEIIRWLSAEGKLFSREKVAHNYPFCWRCDTPLIYYSKPGWYIEMTKLKNILVESNKAVNWFPDYVGERRFGNWIENVNDWAISRSRYWGTPIPIWKCEACGHAICVGSRAELSGRATEHIPSGENGAPDIELHRPDVDEIHIECEQCGGMMNRVPEVMDCWFDSGSMPYAQQHWPFEHTDTFDDALFPADFICEGIDQTRGWFYSLLAISAFVKGRAPYRNVLVNDLILDKNGKKMSKSKGNTADPFKLFDRYGADATRWYLLYTSPAWSPTKFDEDGLKEIAGKFFGTLRNIYYFFALYSNQDRIDPRTFDLAYESRPELDRWILSKYNRLIGDCIADMDAYDHMRAVRRIQNFTVEDLSNWYIRRARRRFWSEGLTEDKQSVYATTYEILVGVSKLAAPMAPFITDEIFTKLTGEENVHLSLYPEADAARIDEALETKMDLARDLVKLGRSVREKERIKVRQPLPAALVDGKYEDIIGGVTDLIREELNIKEVLFRKDIGAYMSYNLKPDFKAAGPVLGSRMKAFAAALAGTDAAALIRALDAGDGVFLSLRTGLLVAAPDEANADDAVEVTRDIVDVRANAQEGFAVAMENGLFVILDTTVTPPLAAEGLAREFVSKVQQLRKQIGLEMMDRVRIRFSADADVVAAVEAHRDYIMKETLAVLLKDLSGAGGETHDLNGHKATIRVEKEV
ncbi:MAG: isoleucine--tRNA ligase, partial [Clostridiales Family XIII bacterium]|jgi:isoleucyl-tRNA synthetase|nr:isoleucine--tRNA ligase [Clostridiales Family XIII bacterium]